MCARLTLAQSRRVVRSALASAMKSMQSIYGAAGSIHDEYEFNPVSSQVNDLRTNSTVNSGYY